MDINAGCTGHSRARARDFPATPHPYRPLFLLPHPRHCRGPAPQDKVSSCLSSEKPLVTWRGASFGRGDPRPGPWGEPRKRQRRAMLTEDAQLEEGQGAGQGGSPRAATRQLDGLGLVPFQP